MSMKQREGEKEDCKKGRRHEELQNGRWGSAKTTVVAGVFFKQEGRKINTAKEDSAVV